ncbi:cytoglobin-1-like [Haemaphysalis longicornis]
MGNSSSADSSLADTVTGLSNLEKQAIRDTWALFKKQIRTSSVAIFVVLFLRYPEYQKMFPLFADHPTAELPKNPKMLAHSLTFAYAITSIVDSLDEPETVEELVRKLATAHAPRSPTMSTQFEHMGCAVVDVLGEKLGAAMTPTATAAWRKLFAFIVSTSAKVFEWAGRMANTDLSLSLVEGAWVAIADQGFPD